METESGMLVVRGLGRGSREFLFTECRGLVLKDEKSSRDWLNKNMNLLSLTELHTLKLLR